MAPEILIGDQYDGLKSDMWSVGVLIDELVNDGKNFYDGKSLEEVFHNILNDKPYYLRTSEGLSPQIKDILENTQR